MTYLFLHPIMHLLLFLSPDWLTFCHVIISHINSLVSLFIFCFSLTKGQCSKRQTILSVLAVHQCFYISIYISTLPTHHTTFIYNIYVSHIFLIFQYLFFVVSIFTFQMILGVLGFVFWTEVSIHNDDNVYWSTTLNSK